MTAARVQLRVSPSPALRPAGSAGLPTAKLFAAAPSAVLGAPRRPSLAEAGVQPTASSCFGPRGAALLADGSLIVADTGHHRLLGWRQMPGEDLAPADWLYGQVDFDREGRNAKGDTGADTLNVPTGVCAAGNGFAVADAWNHRVLVWDRAPAAGSPPDRVFGQPDFRASEANGGRSAVTTAASLHWPYGVHVHERRLFVADSENRRVLVWDDYRAASGTPASTVLGQPDFESRNENAGRGPDAGSMRWPHGIAVWCGRLCVADAGNNRIMVWDGIPDENGAPCDWVLGQKNDRDVDHNQSLYWPRASTLNMPYGIAACGDWLLVADTANSRLLGWHRDDLDTGAPARALLGQRSFEEKGDNRWQMPAADSFCWPYGLASRGRELAVADSGNNRVSLWTIEP